jgi:hypothetical protein
MAAATAAAEGGGGRRGRDAAGAAAGRLRELQAGAPVHGTAFQRVAT